MIIDGLEYLAIIVLVNNWKFSGIALFSWFEAINGIQTY